MADKIRADSLIKLLDKTGLIIERSTGFVCTILLGIMITVVAMGVFFRYVIHNPLQWGEELARFLMLWAGFMAMNIAMRRNEHIKIDIIVKCLPIWMEKIFDYIVCFLVGFFLVILITKGYGMTISTKMTAASLPVSMTWIYASVPLGAILTMIQLILNFLKKIVSDLSPQKQPI